MNILQAGRMISVALRTHSDLFVDRLEVLARKDRLEKDEQLFARFDAAFKERDMGSVLTTVADARQHITDLLASAEMEAASWVKDHKDVPEARAALEGRTRQQRELQGFFTANSEASPQGQQFCLLRRRRTHLFSVHGKVSSKGCALANTMWTLCGECCGGANVRGRPEEEPPRVHPQTTQAAPLRPALRIVTDQTKRSVVSGA
jgi:hypothetical protein